MAKLEGYLPPAFDAAELTGGLTNTENDFNGLVEAMTTKVSSGALEGKIFTNVARAVPHKIIDQKADLPSNHTSSYAVKFAKCDWGANFCLTPDQQQYGKLGADLIKNAIFRGKGHQIDHDLISTLCKPMVYCPSDESGGENVVIKDFMAMSPNGEGLTGDKLKAARNWIQGGGASSGGEMVLLDLHTQDNLTNDPDFKSYDCTYGRGSSLWGDVNKYPNFMDLGFRRVDNEMNNAFQGTGEITQKPILPVSVHYLADGVTIDPENEVHWVPVYAKGGIGYEGSRELCLKMISGKAMPRKMCGILSIDYEFGYGLTKIEPKKIVWIGCLVAKNPCIVWDGDIYTDKFPKVIDGLFESQIADQIAEENGV